MPRVHGIDIVPRRGRRKSGLGGRAASSSSVTSNNDNNYTDSADNYSNADPSGGAAAAASSMTLAVEQNQNNTGDNSLAENDPDATELGKVCGGADQMTLNDTSSHSPHNTTDAGDTGNQQSSHSPTTPITTKNQYSSEDNSISTPAATESQETTIISNKSTSINTSTKNYASNDNAIHNTTTNNSSIIKPQSKESIRNLEFSSHSFSVPSITKKSLSKSHEYDDYGGGGGTTLSFGIGPSLEAMQEEETEPTEQDKTLGKKDAHQSSLAATATKAITALNPNATWLYNQCSVAKSNMEYPHSALHLATKTLTAMRQHYSSNYDSDADEDENIQTVQNLLFELIVEGKKRDLQFVFSVSSRSLELCEDEGFSVDALRDVAVDCGDGDDEMDEDGWKADDNSVKGIATPHKDHDNKGEEDRTPTTAGESTPSPQKIRGEEWNSSSSKAATLSTTPASSMRKNIRSRRKKRHSGRGVDTPNTKEGNAENGNNSKERRADFQSDNDDLNIPVDDDKKWSFLSSPQNKADATNVNNNSDDEEDEKEQQSTASTVDIQQSLDFAAEEDANDVEMTQGDVESVQKELAVSSKNEMEQSDKEEESDTVDDVVNDNEMQEDVEVKEKEMATSTKNDIEGGDQEDESDQEEDTADIGSDSLVKTATLSLEQPNDVRIEGANSISANVDALAQNDIPPLKPDRDAATNNDSDDESKFSQGEGESDLIDEVILSSRKRSDRREVVRIMFTGVTPTRRHMQMIETIGAEIVDSIEMAHTVTHVIVTDGRAKLRRTPKLMICICKTSNILSTEWLEQSANEQKVLDASQFLLIDDKEAESKYNFSMKETVQNGIIARNQRGGVFGGYSFYVCPGIAGNRAPSMKEFKLIIEAAGGHLLNSLAPSEILDPLKTVILTSDPPTPSQLKERGVKNITRCGGTVQTTSWLFHSIITQTNSIYRDDETVESCSTPGSTSRVSHVEVRTLSLEKRQDEPRGSPDRCIQFTTRDQFLTNNQATSWMETLESSEDEAFILANRLWQNYFDEGMKSSKTYRKASSRPTRRLRGRTHSLSPMLGATAASTNDKNLSAQKRESVLHDNSHITWEAVVLFTLQIRARKLEVEGCFFPSPFAIQTKGKTLSLLVNVSAAEAVDVDGMEIFGTLQDVFSLHQKQSSGMIPEQVIASFALMAIEAVSAMHACGVVHNNITLDSFLVTKRGTDRWSLQLIGFGASSVVLTCQERNCIETHYEQDYNCLANVIHHLLSGGIGITFIMKSDGSAEFASKQFINGNMFLRGALSWCALIDALLGIGDARKSETCDQFRLTYPVDFLQHVHEDDAPNKRLYQFGWSCRMLKDQISTQSDSIVSFLQELCTQNSRFLLPNVSLDTYACGALSDNMIFDFATQIRLANENESRHREFARKEAKLEADTLALERRESHYRDKTAQLKVDSQNSDQLHNSLLKRERELQMREDELVQKISQAEERLNRMKDALLLKEQRLEDRITQIEGGKQYPFGDKERRSPHNSSGLKRKSEIQHTPPQTNSKFQSLGGIGGEIPSSQKRRRSRTSYENEQLVPPPSKSDANDMTKMGEQSEQELNEEMDLDSTPRQNESSQESRFSQESSSQKRKRGNRGKSPLALQLDSLQSLPKSPKNKKQPKKVFIAFEE